MLELDGILFIPGPTFFYLKRLVNLTEQVFRNFNEFGGPMGYAPSIPVTLSSSTQPGLSQILKELANSAAGRAADEFDLDVNLRSVALRRRRSPSPNEVNRIDRPCCMSAICGDLPSPGAPTCLCPRDRPFATPKFRSATQKTYQAV